MSIEEFSRKACGTIGELAVSRELLKRGWSVFKDITDNSPIDLIAYKQNRFVRIQVKSQYEPVNGAAYLKLQNANGTYSSNDVDVIACHVVDRNVTFFVSLKKALEMNRISSITVRLDPPSKPPSIKTEPIETFLFENCELLADI